MLGEKNHLRKRPRGSRKSERGLLQELRDLVNLKSLKLLNGPFDCRDRIVDNKMSSGGFSSPWWLSFECLISKVQEIKVNFVSTEGENYDWQKKHDYQIAKRKIWTQTIKI